MSTRATRAVARRIGRRGASLAVLGFVFFVLGLKAAISPSIAPADHFLLYDMLPGWFRAVLWMGSAGVAFYAAARHRPGHDWVGFAALSVPTVFMTVSYLWSTVAFFLGLSDWPNGWASALSWLSILALLSVIAGWSEPVPLREAKHRRRRGH